MATAAVAVPASAQHQHAAKDLVEIASPYKPKFFTAAEFENLTVLVDLIIPRTDTPGASDAGVPKIIDSTLAAHPIMRRGWREGLRWAEKAAQRSGQKQFAALAQNEQLAILRGASEEKKTPGGRFFSLLKDATVDAYYSTREGLQAELGWNGNTYLPEFKGCTHPEHQA
jgi:hypothetical protein